MYICILRRELEGRVGRLGSRVGKRNEDEGRRVTKG